MIASAIAHADEVADPLRLEVGVRQQIVRSPGFDLASDQSTFPAFHLASTYEFDWSPVEIGVAYDYAGSSGALFVSSNASISAHEMFATGTMRFRRSKRFEPTAALELGMVAGHLGLNEDLATARGGWAFGVAAAALAGVDMRLNNPEPGQWRISLEGSVGYLLARPLSFTPGFERATASAGSGAAIPTTNTTPGKISISGPVAHVALAMRF